MAYFLFAFINWNINSDKFNAERSRMTPTDWWMCNVDGYWVVQFCEMEVVLSLSFKSIQFVRIGEIDWYQNVFDLLDARSEQKPKQPDWSIHVNFHQKYTIRRFSIVSLLWIKQDVTYESQYKQHSPFSTEVAWMFTFLGSKIENDILKQNQIFTRISDNQSRDLSAARID